jgi:ABC-type multidrug transport system fused ATPase/permease subunit
VPVFLKNSTEVIRKVFLLARPYGIRKLVCVIAICFLQGVFQILGVTSIFPFLALAADPARLRHSAFGTWLLERLPPMDDGSLLILAGAFAIAMLLLANAVNLAAEFTRTRYAHDFGHWLRVRLLRQMASRPYTDFLRENSAILVKKIAGDVLNYTVGVLLPLLDSLARLATILLLVATLFLVHPQIAIAATLGLALFYLIIFRTLGRTRRTISEGIKNAFRGLCVEAQQMLSGIKPVKVHGCEELFIRRFGEHSHRNARLHAWSSILSNAPRYLIEPLAFGGLVLVVMVSAARGQDLVALLPNLGVMALAGYRLLPAVQLLYGQVTGLTTSLHSLEEVFDEFLTAESALHRETVHDADTFTVPSPLDWKEAITLDHLGFTYPGSQQPVIADLNLTITKNSSLGIIGTTGCGKSTLVDLILGLHVPTSGRILVDQTPLGPENRRAWRAGIGYVPQDVFLIDDTITANIAFGIPPAEVDRDALVRAAAAAQILDFIKQDLPDGFDSVVGERGVRISGGQRQRIGLARALYREPQLLILDEATSALDHHTEDEVMRAIAGLRGQLTMIIVTHRLRTVATCDATLDLTRADSNHGATKTP